MNGNLFKYKNSKSKKKKKLKYEIYKKTPKIYYEKEIF